MSISARRLKNDALLLAATIRQTHNLPVTVIDDVLGGFQVKVEDNPLTDEISIISNPYSYGGRDGLWEAWDFDDNRDPSGWLSIDEAVSYVAERIVR